MFADPEIPIRMTDPVQVEIVLKAKGKSEIGPANQFIEYDAIINPIDPHLASITIINQMPATLFDLGQANRADAEQFLGGGKIDAGFLLFRFDFKQDYIFRIGIGDNGPAEQLQVSVVFDS